MSAERTNPEYRLRNLRRRVKDLVWGRRLAADPEATGVVDLSDFAKRCQKLADFARETVADFAAVEGAAGATVRRLAEELELAARVGALLETLPPTRERIERQCAELEEVLRGIEAALAADGVLEEAPVVLSLSGLARAERELFAPFVAFEGRIEDAPPGLVERGAVRRALRRALLEHASGPFQLKVDRSGTLRFGEQVFAPRETGPGLARSPAEPPEVRRALDLYEATEDPALKEFLLVKAADEALFAVLGPHLGGHELPERARALPRRSGKRKAVRPEAVTLPIPGWQPQEAARAVEKLAARRAGPEWARIPRGAYLLRLFLSEDDVLAEDLLALGPLLRRMEKGEAVAGARERAERCLRGLLGRLG